MLIRFSNRAQRGDDIVVRLWRFINFDFQCRVSGNCGPILCTMLLFNVSICSLISFGGETWGGTGTYLSPAWYDYVDPNGEGYSVNRAQLEIYNFTYKAPDGSSTTEPNAVDGDSRNAFMLGKQIEVSVLRNQFLPTGPVISHSYQGQNNELTMDSTAILTAQGWTVISDSITGISGYIMSFPRFDNNAKRTVNDVFKWRHMKVISAMNVDLLGTIGSVNTSAFMDNIMPPDAIGFPGSKQEEVELGFTFALTGERGSWNFWLQRDLNGANEFCTNQVGDWSGGSDPNALGTAIAMPPGLIVYGLDIDWIYGVSDAMSLRQFIYNHPLPIQWSFWPWPQSYIFQERPPTI